MLSNNGLSEKKKRFVEEWVIDYNGTRAAVAAGYSEKTAASQASRLLKDHEIRVYAVELREKQAEEAGVTAVEVIRGLREVRDRCMQAVPVQEWDPLEHTYVDSEKEYTFDSKGANTALRNLGESIGMFKNKLEVEGIPPPVIVDDIK